ncbi:Rho GTPase activator (Sac7), putative [Talaromyces stipitatus ATCC 10500]|uniref:Rho GTPase activator (Sac7), putative n=1 Tax=Talaromyces stipitatus (strain ATCC 10500 / CBS 375.48 / QM 6759 / NRRL 1006) TaxID=441959 RepID=B8M5G3_TALSN|nr:Rho GTPase activator (Sac7), putative [Talaromyces stipitatus ATCC 10500]EED19769.1 Rho GTPase activator (Sac7), putative [Talaromyces stipitatus ATCC 10500]
MTTRTSQPLAAQPSSQNFTTQANSQEPTPPAAPTKRDLASWWKNFKRNTKKDDDNKGPQPGGIFGVPLNVSIKYANVAISLTNDKGESFIYGYVPIVVAKCGVFLKDQATEVEGIFRLSGSARRIKELQEIFDSPERYGKGLDWTGYTVHDAANILRRYLNQLPEPIVPLDFYEAFREPIRNHQRQAVGSTEAVDIGDFDYEKAVATYQQLIRELPPLNKQLLLYILDLLAVFASKSDKNRMTSNNLSAIFQPGLLSHPVHDMAPLEYRLSQDVLIFLIENQDHFLFGMNGTAADPQTVKEFSNTTAATPGTPSRSSGIRRSASNASGGADSLRKYETLRRNVSVSSRNSGNTQSPGTPTSTVSTVKRSNTVPSKRSPGLVTPRLGRPGESGSSSSAGLTSAAEVNHNLPSESRSPAVEKANEAPKPATQPPFEKGSAEASQFLEAQSTIASPPAPLLTPTKERKISSFFAKSPPTSENKEPRQPNRLKKKRIPGSANVSAQSSSNSLSAATSNESAHFTSISQAATPVAAVPNEGISTIPEIQSNSVGLPEGVNSYHQHQPSESTLKPNRSRTPSMHSKSSYTDQSDYDQYEDVSRSEKRDNRRSWRFPLGRYNYGQQTSSPPMVGSNSGAEFSTSSIGSLSAQGQSFTNESYNPSTDVTSVPDNEVGRSGTTTREGAPGVSSDNEKLSLFDKIKAKVAPKKDGSERAKSPPDSQSNAVASSRTQIEQPKETEPRSEQAQQPDLQAQRQSPLQPTVVIQPEGAPPSQPTTDPK